MRTYYICECCDCIFKTTELDFELEDDGMGGLTGNGVKGIMMEENENKHAFIAGLCAVCREEIYGNDDRIVYNYYGLH